MKTTTHFIFYALLVLITKSTSAQNDFTEFFKLPMEDRSYHQLQEIIQMQTERRPTKKTRSSSRLIARTYHTYNGITYSLNDSFKHTYCSNYGFDPTADFFDHGYGTSWGYNDNNLYDSTDRYFSVGGQLFLREKSFNIFGGNHKLMNNYRNFLSANQYEYHTYLYTLNGKRTHRIDSMYNNGSMSKFMIEYVYDGANKISGFKRYDWDGVAWQNNEIDSLFYDGTGNIERLAVSVYDMVNAVWNLQQNSFLTYNAANQILSVVTDYNANVPTDDVKLENTYDAANRLVTEILSKWSGGTWINDRKTTSTYSAGMYPVTKQYELWDNFANSWGNSLKNDFTFNAENQLETIAQNRWDTLNNVWSLTEKSTFYYQTFNPEAIEHTNTLAADIKLYPIPAQDVLTIDISLAEKQNTKIIVTDITGVQVLNTLSSTDAQYHEALNIESLPSGNYILLLKGEKGTISRKFSK